MTRSASSSRRLAPVALILFVVLGCSPSRTGIDDPGEAVGGTPQVASRMVAEWLHRASTGSGDLGWELLYPTVRTELIGSQESYRNAVIAADWSKLQYAVGNVQTEDGEYRVSVRVQGGSESVPAFMLDWGIIQFISRDGQSTEEGRMTVRIDPSGAPSGIQATG